MKSVSFTSILAVVSVSTLLAAGSAQACMPFMNSSSSCGNAKAQQQSCPTVVEQGRAGRGCAQQNPDLLGAAGEVAANGMQVASKVMRALAMEVDRRMAQNEDF
jgi:hypothetical protein